MVDRISTYWTYRGAVDSMTQQQANLAKTSEQISAGTKLLSPSDDPVGVARVLELDQQISLITQYERNIVLVDSRLEQEETALTNVTDTLQRMRELTVQAANQGVYSEVELDAIAAEMEQLTHQVYDLVNSKDGSGEYLFSGFKGDTQPFVRATSGGYQYQGDEGVRYLQVSQTITVASSDNGKDVFQKIPSAQTSFQAYADGDNTGSPEGVISLGITTDQDALDDFYPHDAVITFQNDLDVDPATTNFTVTRKTDGRVIDGLENVTYVAGSAIEVAGMSVNITGDPNPGDQFIVQSSDKQDVLTTMAKAVYALTTYGTDAEFVDLYNDAMANTLENLDFAIENISTARSEIGARLNLTDNMKDQHADNKLAAQDIRSEISDLDYAEAVSRLQFEEYILQATQQTFSITSQLRLFDFL